MLEGDSHCTNSAAQVTPLADSHVRLPTCSLLRWNWILRACNSWIGDKARVGCSSRHLANNSGVADMALNMHRNPKLGKMGQLDELGDLVETQLRRLQAKSQAHHMCMVLEPGTGFLRQACFPRSRSRAPKKPLQPWIPALLQRSPVGLTQARVHVMAHMPSQGLHLTSMECQHEEVHGDLSGRCLTADGKKRLNSLTKH